MHLSNLHRPPEHYLIGPTSVWSPSFQKLKEAALVIKEDRVQWVGTMDQAEEKFQGIPRFDASNFVITPGFVDSHTHVSLNFLKGLAHPSENVIHDLFFPTESRLTEEIVETLAYSSLYAALRSGVTCVNDHYYFADGVAKAADRLGMKAFVGETTADLGGAFPGTHTWEKFKKTIENWPYSQRIQPVVAPHATDTLSPSLFKELVQFAKTYKLPLHFHLSQSLQEKEYSEKNFNKSPVKLADEYDALGDRTFAVHCLYVNNEDLRLLQQSGACVVVCPSSQVLYEKLAPIEKFVEFDLALSLGTDCASTNDQADVHSELKIFHLFLKEKGQSLAENEVLNMITANPYSRFGYKNPLEAGAPADLVFFESDLQTGYVSNLPCDLIYNFNSQKIKHVMIDGKWALWDQRLVSADETELMKKYESTAMDLRKRIFDNNLI